METNEKKSEKKESNKFTNKEKQEPNLKLFLFDIFSKPSVIITLITTVIGTLMVAVVTNWVNKSLGERELQFKVLSALMDHTRIAKFDNALEVRKLSALTQLVHDNEQFQIDVRSFQKIVDDYVDKGLFEINKRAEELNQKIKELGDDISARGSLEKNLKAELKDLEHQKSDLMSKFSEETQKILKLQEEKKVLNQKIKELGDDISAKENIEKNLRAELKDLDEERIDLKTKFDEETRKIMKFKDENKALNQKIKELGDDVSAKENIEKNLRVELNDLDQERIDLKTKFEKEIEKVMKLQNEKDSLDNDIAKLGRILDNKEEEIDKFSEVIKKFTEKHSLGFNINAVDKTDKGNIRIAFLRESAKNRSELDIGNATLCEFSFTGTIKEGFSLTRKVNDLSFLNSPFVRITSDREQYWVGKIKLSVNGNLKYNFGKLKVNFDDPWENKLSDYKIE